MRRAGRRKLTRAALAVAAGGVIALAAAATVVSDAVDGDRTTDAPVRTALATSPTAVAEASAPTSPSAVEDAASPPDRAVDPNRTEAPSTSHAETSADEGAAVAAAYSLAVIDSTEAIPEYRRSSFGDGWRDLDRDGCSTRNEILARDLASVEWMQDRVCTVASGVLLDPYTGTAIVFQHDQIAEPGDAGSQGVQIDHIVSLSAAHAGGAWKWTDAERIAFSNDPETLIAVDGPTNASKGDRGPGEWLPEDPTYWCAYAADYATIATEYALAVAIDDKQTLIEVLEACQ